MLPAPSNLGTLRRYLDRYQKNDQPAAFEYLVASSLSQMFHLPLQYKSNEDNTVSHRVMWYGDVSGKGKHLVKSPAGPDCVCFACGFDLIGECTLRIDANQWRKELLESSRHYEDFLQKFSREKQHVFLSIIVPAFHSDTHTAFRVQARTGCKVVPLDRRQLLRIVETSKRVLGLRHLDLQRLFTEVANSLRDSSSLDEFERGLELIIVKWQEDIVRAEKTLFFGLKSYEAMRTMQKKVVGTSDILLTLQEDSEVSRYITIIGGGDLPTYIREGLLFERLACLITTPDEDCFCRVSGPDFKSRGLRIIEAVEVIDGQL